MNLRWFRKHQKGMLVVFGAVLMAVFGLGGVVSMIDPGGGGKDPDADKVVVEWKGGKYTRQDLRNALRLHFQTLQFVYTIDGIKSKEQKLNFSRDVPLIQPIQTNVSPESTDIQLVSRLLLAEKAKELGIEIGDDEVDAYIQALSLDPMSEQDMKYTNLEVNDGRVTLKAIKRHLKIELLSQRMEQFLGLSLYSSPGPAEAYYNNVKMNRQVECQVVGFPVADYLSKVTGSPSTDEMKALFDDGQNEYPDPLNSKPGFKKPRELELGYFVADFETFLANEKAKVTPEELKAEYDKWVENKDPKVIEEIEDKKPAPGDNNLSLPGDDDKKSKDDGENKSGAPKPPGSKTDDKKSDDKKSDDKKSDEKKKSDDKSDNGKQEQASLNPQKEILTSLQDKAGKQDTEKSKQAPAKKTETQDKKQDPAPKPPGNQDAGKAGDQEPVKKTRIKKIDEVADEIKTSLKSADARTALENAIKTAQSEMLEYMGEYEIWKRTGDEDEEPEPKRPDFKKMANRLGLEYKVTKKPVTDATISETEIGQIESVRFVRGRNNQIQPSFQKLGNTIFQNYHEARLYDAKKADDFRTRNAKSVTPGQRRVKAS